MLLSRRLLSSLYVMLILSDSAMCGFKWMRKWGLGMRKVHSVPNIRIGSSHRLSSLGSIRGSSTSLSSSLSGSSATLVPQSSGITGKFKNLGRTIWKSRVPGKIMDTIGTAAVGAGMFMGGQFAYDAIRGDETSSVQDAAQQIIIYPVPLTSQQQPTQPQEQYTARVMGQWAPTTTDGEGDEGENYYDENYDSYATEEELPAIY